MSSWNQGNQGGSWSGGGGGGASGGAQSWGSSQGGGASGGSSWGSSGGGGGGGGGAASWGSSGGGGGASSGGGNASWGSGSGGGGGGGASGGNAAWSGNAAPAANSWSQPQGNAAPPSQLNVQGCQHPTIGSIVRGNFHKASENHSKPVYKKDSQVSGLDVMIYYWDERDGVSQAGWWFGPKVGGEQVWAYNPDLKTASPPASGWQVPYGGPIDQSFAVSTGHAQQQAPAQQQQQAWQQPAAAPAAAPAQQSWGNQAQPQAAQQSWGQQSQPAQQGWGQQAQGGQQNWQAQQQGQQQAAAAAEQQRTQAAAAARQQQQQQQAAQAAKQQQAMKEMKEKQAAAQAAQAQTWQKQQEAQAAQKQTQMEEMKRRQEENKKKLEDARAKQVEEQKAKMAEMQRLRENAVKQKQEAEAAKREEMEAKKIVEEQRRVESKATFAIRRIIQKVRVATPENIEQLEKELEEECTKEAPNCGAQAEKIKEEADRGLEQAKSRIEKINEERSKELEKKAALEEAKKAKQVKAQELCEKLGSLVEAAEAEATKLKEAVKELDFSEGVATSKEVESAFKKVQDTETLCKDASKACMDLIKEESATMKDPHALVETKQACAKLLNRIQESQKQVEGIMKDAEGAKAKALKKAVAQEKTDVIQKLFKKYDKDSDKALSQKEVLAYAKGEFGMKLEKESLDWIWKSLVMPDAKGVPFEKLTQLKSIVGVAREATRDKQRTADRIQKEKVIGGMRDKLKAKVAAAGKFVDNAEKAIKAAEIEVSTFNKARVTPTSEILSQTANAFKKLKEVTATFEKAKKELAKCTEGLEPKYEKDLKAFVATQDKMTQIKMGRMETRISRVETISRRYKDQAEFKEVDAIDKLRTKALKIMHFNQTKNDQSNEDLFNAFASGKASVDKKAFLKFFESADHVVKPVLSEEAKAADEEAKAKEEETEKAAEVQAAEEEVKAAEEELAKDEEMKDAEDEEEVEEEVVEEEEVEEEASLLNEDGTEKTEAEQKAEALKKKMAAGKKKIEAAKKKAEAEKKKKEKEAKKKADAAKKAGEKAKAAAAKKMEEAKKAVAEKKRKAAGEARKKKEAEETENVEISKDELSTLFAYLDEDSKGLSKEKFLQLTRTFMIVVKDTAMTSEMGVSGGKPLRKLEAKEVVEVFKGPIRGTNEVSRVQCKALSDSLEGWVSVAGNQGTKFLVESFNQYKVLRRSVMTDAFETSGEASADDSMKLRPGTVLEVREFPKLEESSGLMRMQGKVRAADGRTGWVTTQSKDKKTTFLRAI